jgi:hypothetical protein
VIAGHFDIDDTDPENPIVEINDVSKFLRQYYKFVRAGAVRIEATSDTGTLDPLAFINVDDKYVVVVKADAGADFYCLRALTESSTRPAASTTRTCLSRLSMLENQ